MKARILPAAILMLLTACATTWDVDKFEAPEAGFAARRTYAWTGGDFGTPNEVDPAIVARADRAIRAAIDAELRRTAVLLPAREIAAVEEVAPRARLRERQDDLECVREEHAVSASVAHHRGRGQPCRATCGARS